MYVELMLRFFFFQAEDGIRDRNVTGVQTCALPIFGAAMSVLAMLPDVRDVQERRTLEADLDEGALHAGKHEIGRASCGKSVDLGGRRIIKKKKKKKSRKRIDKRIKCKEEG